MGVISLVVYEKKKTTLFFFSKRLHFFSVFIETFQSNLISTRRQLIIKSSSGIVPNSLGPFTHERVVVGGSVSQLMTETTPRYISIHTFGHRNVSLDTHNVEHFLYLEKKDRWSRNVSFARTWRHAEATAFQPFPPCFMILEVEVELWSWDLCFFFFFLALGWGGLRGVAVPRSCWPASARVWPPR